MINAEFLLTSLVVVLMPGTGVLYTVSAGLFNGRRASIAAAFGCTMGIVPHLMASTLGLSAILHMSSLAFHAVKYAGVVYLLYLAWSMWRETGALQLSSKASCQNLRQIAVRAFLVNILNPKLSIFFLAFLPQFITPHAQSPISQMLVLSSIFMVMTFVIFVLYGLAANLARKYVVNSLKVTTWFQKSFAAMFTLLAAKLAVTEQ